MKSSVIVLFGLVFSLYISSSFAQGNTCQPCICNCGGNSGSNGSGGIQNSGSNGNGGIVGGGGAAHLERPTHVWSTGFKIIKTSNTKAKQNNQNANVEQK